MNIGIIMKIAVMIISLVLTCAFASKAVKTRDNHKRTTMSILTVIFFFTSVILSIYS